MSFGTFLELLEIVGLIALLIAYVVNYYDLGELRKDVTRNNVKLAAHLHKEEMDGKQ